MEDYVIKASDGNIGHVKDVHFDDEKLGAFAISLLIQALWLSRKVLISPILDRAKKTGRTSNYPSRSQSARRTAPRLIPQILSRQQEIRLLKYYGYPYYWAVMGWGDSVYPNLMLTGYVDLVSAAQWRRSARLRWLKPSSTKMTIHLRSCQAVIDYRIHASDGDIAIEDWLIDEDGAIDTQ